MTKVTWHPDTALVHGGSLRSQWGETSEAMFVTQGFVYDSAEQAEARFLNLDHVELRPSPKPLANFKACGPVSAVDKNPRHPTALLHATIPVPSNLAFTRSTTADSGSITVLP